MHDIQPRGTGDPAPDRRVSAETDIADFYDRVSAPALELGDFSDRIVDISQIIEVIETVSIGRCRVLTYGAQIPERNRLPAERENRRRQRAFDHPSWCAQ